MGQPGISIVIPTHNRHAALLRLLRSIEAEARQLPVEVVVVDDGSTHGPAASLDSHDLNLDLRVITQPASGPAAARNRGAAAARGDLLLFLDDDVELLAGSLGAHQAFHDSSAGDIALGDLPPVTIGESFFSIRLRGWGQQMRPGIVSPGYRYNFRDLMTGHFSIRRSCFEQIGGFDAAFRCHEDWEFGYRAIESGLTLRYLPSAVSLHYDTTDVTKALRRKYDEGVADVQLTRKYPALTAELPLGWVTSSRRERLLRVLAKKQPALGDAMIAASLRLLPMWEALTLRFRWRARLERALTYWYWRGVSSATDAHPADGRRIEIDTDAPATVDLRDGVDAAAAQLDRLRPTAVVLTFAGETVACVPVRAGHERLHGGHLRRLLARDHQAAYAQALRNAGMMPAVLTAVPLEAGQAVSATAPSDASPRRSAVSAA